MKSLFYIPYRSKKYACTITSTKEKGVSLVTCEIAGIREQEFANTDIPDLIADLPNIISAVQDHRKKAKKSLLQIRISEQDRRKIEKRARSAGQTISAYLRTRALATA